VPPWSAGNCRIRGDNTGVADLRPLMTGGLAAGPAPAIPMCFPSQAGSRRRGDPAENDHVQLLAVLALLRPGALWQQSVQVRKQNPRARRAAGSRAVPPPYALQTCGHGASRRPRRQHKPHRTLSHASRRRPFHNGIGRGGRGRALGVVFVVRSSELAAGSSPRLAADAGRRAQWSVLI